MNQEDPKSRTTEKTEGGLWTLSLALALLAPTGIFAQEEPKTKVLPEIEVTATPIDDSQGETHLNRKTMDALPKGNGDIPSLLKIHPNVQFDSRALQSGKQGEIAPPDISINGSKTYQNAYRLDGMGISNHLDPASKTENMPHKVSGSAFGMAIDTSLVCDVIVRDSNVAAEFGGFTGGVVEAKTCEPTRDFGGRISYQTTRDSWMRAHVDERFEEAYQNSSDSFFAQPQFTKQSWRLALEGRPAENFGLMGSLVHTTSRIPLEPYRQKNAVASPQNDLTETRQLDNFFLKAYYHPTRDIDLDLSFTHAPGKDRRYINSWQNSGWTNKTGGEGVNFGMVWRLSSGTLSQRLTWTRVEGSRGGERVGDSKWWLASPEKNWAAGNSSAVEGARGPQNQREITTAYSVKYDWNPISLGGMTHFFQAGLEWSFGRAYYERPSPFYYYDTPKNTADCLGPAGAADLSTCSLIPPYGKPGWTGQFFSQKATYRTGRVEAEGNRTRLFFQDEIQKGHFKLRLGLRAQSDELASKSVWAPRLGAFWDVFGDQNTRLEAGLNRYYSDSLYAYELNRGRRAMLSYETRANMASPWTFKENNYDFDGRQKLELPYDDEAMLGLRQRWAGFEWGAKWVKRQGRKQIALHGVTDPNFPNEMRMRYFYNGGKNDADTLSFTLETLKPWEIAGTQTNAQLVIDRTQIHATNLGYGDWLETDGVADLIRYNGTVMRISERPVDNFRRPWTLRLLLNTEIPAARLNWGNFFRYRSGYTQIIRAGSTPHNGVNISNYAPAKFGGALTWDSNLTWTIPTGIARQEAFVTLSLYNLLDRKVPVYDSGNSLGTTYEFGRQFWLEAGLKF